MAMRSDTAKVEQRYILDMLDVDDKRILEIGCGDGRMTWTYADGARQIVGMDVDLESLHNGLNSCPDRLVNIVDFMAGSAIVMPFAFSSFDHVIFAWSF